MMVLGTIRLVFLVTHMQNFWWQMHFGSVPMQRWKTARRSRTFTSVVAAFFIPIMDSRCRPLACICSASLRWASTFGMAFRAVSIHGLAPPRFSALVGGLGKAFSVVVPALFSAIVVFLYFTQA